MLNLVLQDKKNNSWDLMCLNVFCVVLCGFFLFFYGFFFGGGVNFQIGPIYSFNFVNHVKIFATVGLCFGL